MIAEELISNVIPPLMTSDTVQKGIDRMAEFKLSHMPIVNETQFLGLVTEEELIEVRNPQDAVGSISLKLMAPCVAEGAHLYEVIALANQMRLSAIPVVTVSKNYRGLITAATIIEHMATLYSATEIGAVIVLEISNRNNSLAHMAQIIEAENVQILSSYIRSYPESTKLEVTLKVNKTEIGGVLASFERYNYTIVNYYNTSTERDDTDDRYNSFMNYLNV